MIPNVCGARALHVYLVHEDALAKEYRWHDLRQGLRERISIYIVGHVETEPEQWFHTQAELTEST